jgi:hypothetical protein
LWVNVEGKVGFHLSVLFGYKVVDGKTVIDEMAAEQVKTVFREYLQGASLSETAQKAKIFVSHGSIVNMLRNGHYLGDKYYPAIIDQNTFLKVQEERSRRAIKLGRVYEPNEEIPRVIPTQFYIKESPQHCDDPFQQAEQTYHLIKIGVKENG